MSSLAYLLPDNAQEIDFDLVLSETHTNASELTGHPVEMGVDISDHVKHNPLELSLEVWMTNAPTNSPDGYGGIVQTIPLQLRPKPQPKNPITRFFNDLSQDIHDAIFGPKPPLVITGLFFPAPFDRVHDTHAVLGALERAGTAMTVVTSTIRYVDMVLQKVGYSKTEAGCGTFSLDFKQARFVTTTTVAAPAPAEPRGAPTKAQGSQATKPTDPKTSKSLALKVLDGAKGALGL